MRLLVVDDDANVRASLRRLITRRYNADVVEANDGVLALQLLLRYQCDLVILDLHMATLDGIDTLKAIRRSLNHKSTPVMMLTGSSDEELVGQAIGLGVLDYLVKPVDATLLFERIAAALARCGKEDMVATARRP